MALFTDLVKHRAEKNKSLKSLVDLYKEASIAKAHVTLVRFRLNKSGGDTATMAKVISDIQLEEGVDDVQDALTRVHDFIASLQVGADSLRLDALESVVLGRFKALLGVLLYHNHAATSLRTDVLQKTSLGGMALQSNYTPGTYVIHDRPMTAERFEMMGAKLVKISSGGSTLISGLEALLELYDTKSNPWLKDGVNVKVGCASNLFLFWF